MEFKEKIHLRQEIKVLCNKFGQVVVLYALLAPFVFLFIGLALDLGWYYLNVSRLQNAADSAAVAGAQTMLSDEKNFTQYKSVLLVGYYPKDKKYYCTDEEEMIIQTVDEKAARYISENLSSKYSRKDGDNYLITDGWNASRSSEVIMDSSLYEGDEGIYYVVHLNESIRHLLLPGLFDDMDAPVTAIALLSKAPLNDSESD